MANQIVVAGPVRREEGLVSAAFSPGHLVELTTAGKWQKHATEGGIAERAFATEDALQGKIVSDAYVADNVAQVAIAQSGTVLYGMLKASQNVAINAKLISAGDGTLIADGQEDSLTTVRDVIAVALEALDLSASDAVDTLIKLRVL